MISLSTWFVAWKPGESGESGTGILTNERLRFPEVRENLKNSFGLCDSHVNIANVVLDSPLTPQALEDHDLLSMSVEVVAKPQLELINVTFNLDGEPASISKTS